MGDGNGDFRTVEIYKMNNLQSVVSEGCKVVSSQRLQEEEFSK